MTDPTPHTTPTRDEAVPTGWKLVPVEPTEAMMAIGRTCGTNSANTYAAMLASAPAPASGGVDAVAAIAKIIDPECFKLLAEGNNLTTGQAANYRDAYGKAHLILASLSPAAAPVSEAGGDDWMEQKAAREKREAEIMQEYRWGNLTPLGVANHLKRAGFNIDYAVKVSNALATPASSPAGGDVVETLVPLKWRHVDVEQFEAHSIIGTYEVCGQHWSFVPTLKKAGAEMGSLDEARKAAQSHRDMYGPQPRRAALSQSTYAGRVGE